MTTLDRLPEHPVPEHARANDEAGNIFIDGLVERPGPIASSVLADLPRAGHDGDFYCEEGWTVPDLRWQGVRLSAVLAIAGPLPGARYVRIGSGEFVLPMPIEAAKNALLCDRLDGEPLTAEHGAPWRLMLPGGECFTSVKWVDRIELTETAGDNTAESIARARIGQG